MACGDCETIGDKVLFSFIGVSLNSGRGEGCARVDFSIQWESVGFIYFSVVDSAAHDGNNTVAGIGWINYIINSYCDCGGCGQTDLHIDFVADTKHVDFGARGIAGNIRIISEMTFKEILGESKSKVILSICGY